MATITAQIVPPPAPPEPRIKLELDLSVDEAYWLKELFGRVLGYGNVRIFTTALFRSLQGQLSSLPGYERRQDAFQGEVRSLE